MRINTVVEKLFFTAAGETAAVALAYVKNYLKVDDSTDDTLITQLILTAKNTADNFLQNDFRVIRNEEIGTGDDSTLIFNLDNTKVLDRSLELYILDEGTDPNLAAYKPEDYGSLQIVAESTNTNDYSIDLTTGVITFVSDSVPDEGEIVYAHKYRLKQDNDYVLPTALTEGVLQTIAYMYEHRTDGVAACAVSGLGAVTLEVPQVAKMLWSPWKKVVGL